MDGDFRHWQNLFVAWLREGRGEPPDIYPSERMQTYRNLVFGNLESTYRQHFPRLHRYLGAQRWKQLVAEYLRSKHARSPIYHEMMGEFLEWLTKPDSFTLAGLGGALPLEKDRQKLRAVIEEPDRLMLELAHFDWIRYHLEMQEDPEGFAIVSHAELTAEATAPLVLLSIDATMLGYQHQVHLKSPSYCNRQAVQLLMFRDSEGKVSWHSISSLCARMGAILSSKACSPSALIEQVQKESGAKDKEAFSLLALHQLHELASHNVLVTMLTGNEKEA